MSIQNNVVQARTSRFLNTRQKNMKDSNKRLASGDSLTSAGDGAAQLAISQSIRAKIGGLDQAVSNAQDGASFVQTAEGALDEVSDILNRAEELAIQAANDTLAEEEKNYIYGEIEDLAETVETILEQTEFNGIEIFSGEEEFSFQIGANSSQEIGVEIDDLANNLNLLDGADLLAEEADEFLENLKEDRRIVSNQRVSLGSVENRLEHAVDNVAVTSENLQSSESKLRDTDLAEEYTNLSKEQLLYQYNVAMSAEGNLSSERLMDLLQ